MKLESFTLTRDLLYDPIAHDGFPGGFRRNPCEQRPKRLMRRGKTRQVVLPERQRFSQLQRAGQRAEILAGEVGKRAARRLVENQRFQSRVAKPGQKRLIPRLMALR